MVSRFFVCAFLVFIYSGCNRKGCTDPLALNFEEKAKKDDGSCVYAPQTQTTIHFSHVFDLQQVNSSVFNDLVFINEFGTTLSINKLKYHISDIRFYTSDGDSLMTDDYHYVDLSDDNTLSYTIDGHILQNNYTGIGFLLGFNQEDNISGSYSDLNAVNWAWPESLGGGYHQLQLEGRYINTLGDTIGYAYHCGSTIKNTSGASTTYPENYIWIKLPFTEKSFGESIHVYLEMNVAEWFKNPTIWDLNLLYNGLMDDYNAQMMMKENGADVFSLKQITD